MRTFIYDCKDMRESAYGLYSYIIKNRVFYSVIDFQNEKEMEQMMSFLVSSGLSCSYLDEGIAQKGLLMTCQGLRVNGVQTICVRDSSDILPEKCDGVILPGMKSKSEFPDRNVRLNLSDIPDHLKNEQIRPVFEFAFEIAEQEIDIISPWMNRTAVNDTLIEKMERALQRGVKIKIIYGIGIRHQGYNPMKSERSDRVARELSEKFSQYGNRFSIVRDNIHYKLVLCDELFRLEGGFNYLSFLGDYSEPGIRREGTPFDRNVDMIRKLRREYF